MHVIGTAGHVDHGKSSLVNALTGINPDRLKEEQRREMTIDLGFAWLTLADGTAVGIVDVPGHRDFIENMLAGVGGIDAVLFVVAADEGVMPQTREHLAILDLLQIPASIVVLTKVDLVTDDQWLELVKLELSDVLRGSVLQEAPVVPVSVRSGQGLTELRAILQEILGQQPPHLNKGKPRLWIDRVFSMAGFGTVVTGTLLDGNLEVGQEVELQPAGLRCRIRGLQSHRTSLQQVDPGRRVAVNLAGVEKSQVRRGDLVCLPDTIQPTHRLGVQYRQLSLASRPLSHHTPVKFFCGSAETLATVRVLEGDSIATGREGWLQIELRDALPLNKGDRFILRTLSPAETIGGGQIIDPAAHPRWRRNRPEVIARLEALAQGEPHELVHQWLATDKLIVSPAQIGQHFAWDTPQVEATVQTGLANGLVIRLADGRIAAVDTLHEHLVRLRHVLHDFHAAQPLLVGIRPEVLRKQWKFSNKADFEAILEYALVQQSVTRTPTAHLALPDHHPQPSRTQQAAIDQLLAAFAAAPYTPPSVKEAAASVGDKVLAALLENGILLQVSEDVLLTPQVVLEWGEAVRHTLNETGSVSIRTLRDNFQTSRKYAQAFLERLNALGITRREGDNHVLASGQWDKLG